MLRCRNLSVLQVTNFGFESSGLILHLITLSFLHFWFSRDRGHLDVLRQCIVSRILIRMVGARRDVRIGKRLATVIADFLNRFDMLSTFSRGTSIGMSMEMTRLY
jgi:hypothetical protein